MDHYSGSTYSDLVKDERTKGENSLQAVSRSVSGGTGTRSYPMVDTGSNCNKSNGHRSKRLCEGRRWTKVVKIGSKLAKAWRSI